MNPSTTMQIDGRDAMPQAELTSSSILDPDRLGKDFRSDLDKATYDVDSLTVEQMQRILLEVQDQPAWRYQCDMDADYYDGHQLDGETLQLMAQKGFPPLIENLIRPTVNVVLGMEAKTRTDWVVKADSDQWVDVADASNARLKEVEREALADRACSDAYAQQIKTGVSCVEIGRSADPFLYPYRVRTVHRREIAWDWKFREPDQQDMRYFVRRQWFDLDQMIVHFPKHRELINQVGSGWGSSWMDYLSTGQNTGLGSSQFMQRASSIEQLEFMDTFRKRISLSEVWYRIWKYGPVLKLPNKRVVPYSKQNTDHVRAVGLGLIKPFMAPYSRVRLSYWIGPYRLADTASPYAHNRIPYILFFGYREDRSNAPYGLVRSMRNQQDEVNARKSKMMWLLSSKQVVADGDAVKDHNIAKNEVARADAYIILNENRRPTSKFEISQDLALSDQQFKVYEQARQSLQDVEGIFNALMGKQGGADSGVAINQLVEQGSTTLAEINDNYRFHRREVGRILLELVKENIENGETVTVGEGTQRREVTMNEAAEDELGAFLKNDVMRAGVSLVLDDVPSTPTFRAHLLTQLSEITKSLPPELQAIIAPYWIEATDWKGRKEIADKIRRKLGEKVKPTNEEDAAAMQAEMQGQQAVQQMQMKAAQLDLEEKQAKIEEHKAKTQTLLAEMNAPEAEDKSGEVVEQAQAMVDQLRDEATREIQGLQQKLEDAVATAAQQQRESQIKGQAEVEKAKLIEQSKAQIESVRAESAAVMTDLMHMIEKLEAKMTQMDKDHKDDSARRDKEGVEKDRAREKETKERDGAEKREEKAVLAPAPAAPINVEVKIEQGAIQVGGQGASKSFTIKKNADGSMTGESKAAE